MNLAILLERAADRDPYAPAIVGTRPRTWGELRERVGRLAGGLVRRGVGRGDRVAVLGGNCAEYLEIYLALAWLGALVVPLNTRLSAHELRFHIDDAGVRLWLVADSLGALADATAPELARVSFGDGAASTAASYDELLTAAPAVEPLDVPPAAPLGIFYTGGTTGRPKGVILTHGNLAANSRHVVPAMGFAASDVFLHAAPMFHLADLGYLWALMSVGGTHAFLAPYTPEGFLEAVERLRVTSSLLAPSMVGTLVRSPDLGARDLRSWSWLAYGGSPITEETLRRALGALPCRLYQGYGQTEATHTVCLLAPEAHAEALTRPALLASCGRPIPGIEVRISMEDGRPARPGVPGELLVRGPTVMAGYWERPVETAETLADGWLHTGDVATTDADGFVYVLDRKKDVIVSGGENIFSAEVESVLARHGAVLEVAVIAVPDDVWGERVHAVVVLAPGRAATAEELQGHCRQTLGGYKLPRSFEFVESLPRTPTGKIVKSALREPHWAGRSRAVH